MTTAIVNQFISQQAYNRETNRHMVDLSVSGQYGHVPDHRVWADQTPYISGFTYARVIRAPRGFADMPEPHRWYAALKNLVERHVRSIQGLTSTLQVDVRETPWAWAGEQFQIDANVTQERSQVQLQLGAELYGMPYHAFVDAWIRNLIRNPQTKYANVTQFDQARRPDNLLADYRGATILYFEPDPTLSRIQKAWMQFNSWPMAGIPFTSQGDKISGGELLEHTLGMTGITMTSLGINKFAERFLTGLTLQNSNPALAPATVSAVQADLLAAKVGDEDNIRRAAEEHVSI